jgi:hypothetical protein
MSYNPEPRKETPSDVVLGAVVKENNLVYKSFSVFNLMVELDVEPLKQTIFSVLGQH